MNFEISKYFQFLIAPSGQIVRGFVSIYIVNLYLGIASIGVWAQILACHAFMYLFVNFNLTQSMSRFYPKILKNNFNVYSISNSIFLINLTLILIYFFLLFPFKDPILNFVYDSNYIIGFYLLASLFIIENLYNVIYCHYRSTLNAKKQAYLALTRLFFELLFFFPFLFFYSKFYLIDIYIFLSFYIFFVLLSILLAIFFLKEYKKIFTAKPLFVDYWKEFFSYGLRLLPMSIAFWITSQADRWFITGKYDHESLGYYFIATRFFIIYAFLVSPFHSIYTYIASENDSDIENFRKVIYIAVVISLLFSVILYISHPLILVFFNLDQNEFASVSNLVPYMLISGFLYTIYTILNTFRLINTPGLVSFEWIILSLFYLSFLFILPSYYGINGFIYAQILSYLIIISFVLLKLKYNKGNAIN